MRKRAASNQVFPVAHDDPFLDGVLLHDDLDPHAVDAALERLAEALWHLEGDLRAPARVGRGSVDLRAPPPRPTFVLQSRGRDG